jgi:hypothetical protein
MCLTINSFFFCLHRLLIFHCSIYSRLCLYKRGLSAPIIFAHPSIHVYAIWFINCNFCLHHLFTFVQHCLHQIAISDYSIYLRLFVQPALHQTAIFCLLYLFTFVIVDHENKLWTFTEGYDEDTLSMFTDGFNGLTAKIPWRFWHVRGIEFYTNIFLKLFSIDPLFCPRPSGATRIPKYYLISNHQTRYQSWPCLKFV